MDPRKWWSGEGKERNRYLAMLGDDDLDPVVPRDVDTHALPKGNRVHPNERVIVPTPARRGCEPTVALITIVALVMTTVLLSTIIVVLGP